MSATTRRHQLEALLADSPDDAELRYFLAMEHLSADDAEGALRCFRDVHQADVDYVPAYLQAAQTLARLGRPAEAIQELREGMAAARKKNDLHAFGEMEGLLATLE
jgi:predicted Zn-dependent protease